ncbi:hypothetical protein GCM10007989_19260 [Devosia pacifica]|uniref:Peptidase metallopeptidase domain-containing protein n=1 Tax=Devosia pacifica TaxID=1335967 RepID=A0A918S4A8_9HYPH|nr:DUF4214 domain-containing protein [Devosia pacifica]GHA23838.1 hypothetical protein GCM10007989_19260 [Devosia pacifica]
MAYAPTPEDVAALTGYEQTDRWNAGHSVGTASVVTFSFASTQAAYDAEPRPGFAAFSEAHKSHVRQALDLWARDTGLSFVEVPESVGGQIRFGMFDMTGETNATGKQLSGYGYTPTRGGSVPSEGNTGIGGDVFLNAAYYADDAASIAPGVRGYSILIHEVGHAIGFKHPFSGTPTIDAARDNGDFTIMSYDRPWSTTELGPIDLAAAQLYYGTDAITASYDAASQRVLITATDAANTLLGTELSDTISAGSGNDVILASAGSDLIDGGDGIDTLAVRLSRASTSIESSSGITVALQGHTTSLNNVERVAFSDGTLAFDIEGNAGQAYRLYQAAFARTPDNDGLKFWVGWMDEGGDLGEMGARFIDSAEFETLYAGLDTTEAFVNQLYNNILGRDGEAEGLAFWTGEIESGRFDLARVLVGFSESPENLAKVSTAIEDGIWYV